MNALLLLLISFIAVSAIEEIRFSTPASLAKLFPDGVENKPALFGMPGYRVSITGRLIYGTPGNRDGCDPIDTSSVANFPTEGTTYIMMFDRGTCTFVQKVRHAQIAGAKGVIIVDNIDENMLISLADDGTGAAAYITTPSLFISKHDGQKIKDAMTEDVVLTTLRLGFPHSDGIVEWTLWTSSYDDTSAQLKHNFKDAIESLGDKSIFNAHYIFLDGAKYGCTGKQGTACGNQCSNSGKYCAPDPEHDADYGVSGMDVVQENLRQLCVAKLSKDKPRVWWDYVSKFEDNCAEDNKKFNADCSFKQAEAVGLTKNDILQCIADSGGYEENGGVNTLIQEEINIQSDQGAFLLPTILINNGLYKGSLSCKAPIDVTGCGVLQAICSAYTPGMEPEACNSNTGCPLGQVRDECSGTETLNAVY